jgi:Mrp family chromosome partitioning ATPase
MNEARILSRADIYEKKQEIEKSRVETEFNRLEENKKRSEQLKNFSLDALEAKKGELNAKKAIGILERDKQLIKQSITFVSPEFSAVCPLTAGGIYLVGAISGTGKSTTTAALAHTLYTEGKNTFIISNEETSAKIYARIACADLGVDFNMFIQDKVPDNIRKQVAHKILEIEPYVTVADDPVGSTTIEPMEKLLHEVDASGRYACVIIDFAQRVVKSIKNPAAERTQVLYAFKDILTDYAQNAKIPVVLMTQLKPLPSDEIERNFEARIKWCTALMESAAAAVEIIKLKGLPVSIFYTTKGRFSKADISITHRYDCGKFNFINKQQLKKIKDTYQMQKLNDLAGSLRDDENEDIDE